MAVNKNPYMEWEELRENSDYRSTDTQMASLVRQQLSQTEYLRSSNRVNSGPLRNRRAAVASLSEQVPHPLGSEDLWGWQHWTENNPLGPVELPEAENLFEVTSSDDIPGKGYGPYSEAEGASI